MEIDKSFITQAQKTIIETDTSSGSVYVTLSIRMPDEEKPDEIHLTIGECQNLIIMLKTECKSIIEGT